MPTPRPASSWSSATATSTAERSASRLPSPLSTERGGGIGVVKNVVVCLDGTGNQIKAAANTNVIRLFELLDLRDPEKQVAYYDPGVGTFASPAAWTPVARTISRLEGLAFGAGLRQNL